VSGRISICVCASGGGSTLQNLIDRVADGRLDAEIVRVVAGRPGIGAIDRAVAAGIAATVVERGQRTVEAFSAEVFDAARDAGAGLVVLAGFLSLLKISVDFHNRVINIHPSLIPAFSGKGFHGEAVHRAAIEAGVKVSGCTVHYADDAFDSGPIILQEVVPVLDDDTTASLAARVFAAECVALPEAIRRHAEGRLVVRGRRVTTLAATP